MEPQANRLNRQKQGGDYMFEKCFIDACLAGDVILDEVEEFIEYWHTHDTGVSLSSFLGMTEYEYAKWLKTGEDIVLRDIIESRNINIPYIEYENMSSERRIAARSYKQNAVDEIKNRQTKVQ